MKQAELSNHIQDSIVLLAITSKEFLQIIRTSLDPAILPSELSMHIVRSCFRYYDTTKDAPRDHFFDVITSDLHHLSKAKREILFTYIDRISQLHAPNIEYVVRRLSDFIKTREFEIAAVQFVKLVEKREFDQAHQLMTKALKAGVEKENIGCDYFKDYSSLSKSTSRILMSTGITELDILRQGYKAGEFLCVLGGYKGKKSWYGVHLGKTALLQGLNVLHISHEVTQEELEERYDRAVGALTGWHIQNTPFDVFEYNEATGLVEKSQLVRPCISDNKERIKARETLRRFGGRLIIRKYPMGTCSMIDLDRYLNYLENFESFAPDVIINDYPDIQRPIDGTKQTRDQLNETYMYHKRIADERNALVVAFSQANRGAIRAKKLSMRDFAEDIRKLANVDTVIGICQTDTQALSSVGTLFVVAARQGVMDRSCEFVMNLDIGQFCTASWKSKERIIVDDDIEEDEE